MRIGMDYRPAMQATTGIGRYVGGLVPALARELELRLFGVFWRGNRPERRRAPAGTRLVAWPVPTRIFHVLPADRALGGCDLFHHTNYLLARVGRNTPQVMTIHDLAWLRDPAFHTPRAAAALTRIVSRAARRCAAFLVPSEATARDCEQYLGLGREKIFVTPLGVGNGFVAPAPPRGRPYLLAVGTLEPRKNYARLIRAFLQTPLDWELRIAGARGWRYDAVLEAAARSDRVRLLGHVSETELRAQLAGATAVVYPSLLEGFGLPVLEAMAAGRPVLTSDREPLSSLAGDAALLVDPTDEDAIAHAIVRLAEDEGLRQRLSAAGPARARAFTWERCAAATRAAYAAVLA